MVVTVDKEMNGEPSFIGDLTKAVDDDQSFCEEQGFLVSRLLSIDVCRIWECEDFQDSQQQDICSKGFCLLG